MMMDARRHYDVEMIRDFLNCLAWELRRVASGPDDVPGEQNEEIESTLHAFDHKYSTRGLLHRVSVDDSNVTPERAAQCSARLRELRAKEALLALQALDFLEPVFDEALACADPDPLARVRHIQKRMNGEQQ